MSFEFDEKLSYLEKPSRADVPEEDMKVYEENVALMEKNWGFINNLFKVLPLNSSQYMGFFRLKDLSHPRDMLPDNADKEIMGLVISSTNAATTA